MAARFHRFHESWIEQLQKLTTQLTKTSSEPNKSPNGHDEYRQRHIPYLVDKVVNHYEDYYRAKSTLTRTNVLSVFAAPWESAIERALHWAAGFRPTTLFHLIYTESSARFEARVFDILQGISTGDLGELSPAQLARVSELQCQTVKEENEIGVEFGEWQDQVARAEPDWATNGLCGGTGVEALLEKLARLLGRADELRIRTLKNVMELLTPQQALEFLIPAAELQFGIRGWGAHHDGTRGVASYF